jgi:hypothetical protein
LWREVYATSASPEQILLFFTLVQRNLSAGGILVAPAINGAHPLCGLRIPLGRVGWDKMLRLFFQVALRMVGKSNRLFSKKIGTAGRKGSGYRDADCADSRLVHRHLAAAV